MRYGWVWYYEVVIIKDELIRGDCVHPSTINEISIILYYLYKRCDTRHAYVVIYLYGYLVYKMTYFNRCIR